MKYGSTGEPDFTAGSVLLGALVLGTGDPEVWYCSTLAGPIFTFAALGVLRIPSGVNPTLALTLTSNPLLDYTYDYGDVVTEPTRRY